jgi:hypothetical protein
VAEFVVSGRQTLGDFVEGGHDGFLSDDYKGLPADSYPQDPRKHWKGWTGSEKNPENPSIYSYIQ